MPLNYSLAYLSAAPRSPPDVLTIAAKAGYQHIGIRIMPAAPGGSFADLMQDKALLAATVGRIAETGVGVFDVEIVRLAADFKLATYRKFLEVCAAVRAKAVLVAGDDPDEGRLTSSFAEFCEAAQPFGLTADLEFMPWTAVRDCKTALRIVTNAGQANGGVLVDALHVARSTTSLSDIKAVPRNRLNYAQICDGPAQTPKTNEELIHSARRERLLPGEGGIDLAGIFAALPPDLPVSVEVPNDNRIPLVGEEAWARQALALTKATLVSAEKRRSAQTGKGI